MKYLAAFIGLFLMAFTGNAQQFQEDWPKTISTDDGSTIKIYEPTPESFSGNILKTRSAVSLLAPNATDPVFGTFWAVETVQTDRDNRNLTIVSVKVPNIKFASDQDAATTASLKATLETQIPQMSIVLPMDELLTSLDQNTEEKKLSKGLSNNPPKIIYANQTSILVLIDGAPQFQKNNNWGLDAVVNTPFTIVKNTDGSFYLYGGKKWYNAPAVTGPYHFVADIPNNLNKVQTDVDNADNADPAYTSSTETAAATDVAANIIVATTPTELVQSDGEPVLTNIDNTSLSYVSNSENDIFFNQGDGQYYVLLSGRWYKSASLQSNWQFVASNALPADFAKIPEGSPKDNVLASVAGTDAAREAIIDAQIPQTAKVDRQSATTSVSYDGDPQFENIEGTKMQYATNTQNSVIFSNGKYYDVDNGVWFESATATGPWTVCVNRPDEVDMIPASYPVYNMKYVYIYDVQPDWVYMGYTPGYLNTFIYGPTVVYGTGFYYKPWRGNYYFPRPATWGFSMHYNPWAGWSIGFNYRSNWFHAGFANTVVNKGWNGWRGGWWGPAVYHPPFRTTAIRTTGYYGARPAGVNRVVPNFNNRQNSVRNNNIYNYRRDVSTVNNNRSGNGNSFMPVRNQPGNRGQQNSNVITDRAGNVYQRNNPTPAVTPPNNRILPNADRPTAQTSQTGGNQSNNNQWQQRQQGQWRPVTNAQPNVIQNLDHQQQQHERGQTRVQNFQSSNNTPVRQAPAANQNNSRPANTNQQQQQQQRGNDRRHN